MRIRSGDFKARWFRDRIIATTATPVRVERLTSGRKVYWLPRFQIADIGAAPRRDAREIADFARREKIRILIWRQREIRDCTSWDRELPPAVKSVIATGEGECFTQRPRHRHWLRARGPLRFRY